MIFNLFDILIIFYSKIFKIEVKYNNNLVFNNNFGLSHDLNIKEIIKNILYKELNTAFYTINKLKIIFSENSIDHNIIKNILKQVNNIDINFLFIKNIFNIDYIIDINDLKNKNISIENFFINSKIKNKKFKTLELKNIKLNEDLSIDNTEIENLNISINEKNNLIIKNTLIKNSFELKNFNEVILVDTKLEKIGSLTLKSINNIQGFEKIYNLKYFKVILNNKINVNNIYLETINNIIKNNLLKSLVIKGLKKQNITLKNFTSNLSAKNVKFENIKIISEKKYMYINTEKLSINNSIVQNHIFIKAKKSINILNSFINDVYILNNNNNNQLFSINISNNSFKNFVLNKLTILKQIYISNNVIYSLKVLNIKINSSNINIIDNKILKKLVLVNCNNIKLKNNNLDIKYSIKNINKLILDIYPMVNLKNLDIKNIQNVVINIILYKQINKQILNFIMSFLNDLDNILKNSKNVFINYKNDYKNDLTNFFEGIFNILKNSKNMKQEAIKKEFEEFCIKNIELILKEKIDIPKNFLKILVNKTSFKLNSI